MTDRGDGHRKRDRAVTVQIGAVILFGFLIVALSTYQATVVPDQNAAVEFRHSQAVQTDMITLSSSITATGRTGDAAPVTVKLGTRYPRRTFFVNPPPASGRLQTVDPPGPNGVSLGNLTVVSSVDSEAGDYWNASGNRNKSTTFVVYRPSYNNYREAPTTRYESSVVFNRFPGGANLTLTDQSVVEGDRITVVAVSGDLGRSGVSAVTVDPEAVSTVSRRERVSGTLNVTIPTTLNATRWEELLADEIADGWVNGTRNAPGGVTIELNDSRTYSLGIAAVHVGSGEAPDRSPAYLDVEQRPSEMTAGTTREVVVEVRDQFGNPVAGVGVTGVASDGSFANGASTTVRTDDRGRAVFEYTAGSADATLDFSFDSNPAVVFNETTPEDARVSVTVTDAPGGGGGASTYDLVWDTDRITSDNTGVTYYAANDTLVVDRATSGGSLQMTARATDGGDDVSGVSVDYASNNTAGADFTGGDSEGVTGNDGRSTVTMDLGAGNQTAKVYASSAQSSDILSVRIRSSGGGIYYRYYEADFGNEGQPSDLNLDSRTPVETGEKLQFTIGPENREDNFAYAYTAYIDVPQNGTYTFYTNSDDGSWLYIDGTQIVDNGGDHAAQEESGSVTLTEGQHNITIYMYENRGRQVLDVSWEGPGTGGKQAIPTSVLTPRPTASGEGGAGTLPSNADAFNDANGNGEYDSGETTYTASDFDANAGSGPNGDFGNQDIVLAKDITVGKLDMSAGSFTARDVTVETTTENDVVISTNRGIDLRGSTVETGNGNVIELKASQNTAGFDIDIRNARLVGGNPGNRMTASTPGGELLFNQAGGGELGTRLERPNGNAQTLILQSGTKNGEDGPQPEKGTIDG
ncbi:PA14 domain-containing protein [Halobaculum gomorrense]|uniref:PA14 domain-containing protein n=1 Tax=Halobaculum gomorrense TaxID=43928 RepID=A0A1M5TJQ6_9EURY|nr:PA14 domain-containing protein [Halobaculum gomorrense]SHH51035.1 PA14 domain-containing protein [Halobaculum gomorrense]